MLKGVGKPRIALEGAETLRCDEEYTVLGGEFVVDRLENDSTLAVLCKL